MSLKKDHGDRNLNLSEDLRRGNVYYDWCITTSFYSAIQFVEDKLFPLKLEGKDCNNLSEAKIALRFKGRHETRLKLVYDHLGLNAGVKYQWLENKSRNARYISYKSTVAEAEKALQFCRELKDICYQ
ncbi:hypothetical protein H8B06_18605 [Sphingobacterium sp. DN00404]|uniref:HEPN domain-containing protein n=1 Tax=Sphingobacterium micropteri TaxID=2763501 RepID=A0ABR7YUD6_9SPHI|nr:hypothetical protein [Sphingobacterium micropteri]MBD1434841.1 hypothetical protein [Sphingobacterium micropteri]